MSSSEIAIRVNNLSKCYQVYEKPGDRLKQFVLPRLRRLLGLSSKHYFREFWALNDVSFEVKRGETLGIIGRNGSGKSTLLQIICGTLSPTSGSIETNGRLAALLELGSGFNPEFTGSENLYLNASILGLTKEEIDLRFDDIVAFADIGEFIGQPVKTYSSGMMVRLAFAVIAHVDADILVVDEALAVGDAIFTQKCMQFIREFKKTGTLLFVSHDNNAVQTLCDFGMWLKEGSVESSGQAKDVCDSYFEFVNQEISGPAIKLSSINKTANINITKQSSATNYSMEAKVVDNMDLAKGFMTGDAELLSIDLSEIDSSGDAIKKDLYQGGELVRLTVNAKTKVNLNNPILGFQIADRLGQYLFGENTLEFTNSFSEDVRAGESFRGIFEFNLPYLPNGDYAIMASVADGSLEKHVQHHWLHDAKIITVSSSKVRYGLIGIPYHNVTFEKLT